MNLKHIMAYAGLAALPLLEAFIIGTYFLCGLFVIAVTGSSIILAYTVGSKLVRDGDAEDIRKGWADKGEKYANHLLDACCLYLPLVFTLGVLWPLLLSLFNIIVVLPYLFKKLEENYGGL